MPLNPRRSFVSPASPGTGGAAQLRPVAHADDCGMSVGITDGIIGCYDHGVLRGTSVVVNGEGWAHAVTALRQRPGLSVALHLNLFEGPPLSPASEVDLLVNRAGRFHRGFAELWSRGATGSGAVRLRSQVRLELRRQIERFLEVFGDRGPMAVDGHVHYHVLPLVLEELLTLSAEYPLDAMRLPREPLYWPLTRGAPRPPLSNLLKNLVLRSLSHRAERALRAHPLKTAEAFVGVLGTGVMTFAHVRAALEHLHRAGVSGDVEFLFHPGRARADEASLWSDRPALQAFYLSDNRHREAELLCNAALARLFDAYSTEGRDVAVIATREVGQ
jgi:predicted glycoside hydrolase/deacetylase ChbG (UPF0249 family)